MHKGMYDKMSNEMRNKKLVKMLDHEKVVLFPANKVKSIDGMPSLNFLNTNSKIVDMVKKPKEKTTLKETCDFGLGKKKDGEEKRVGGGTFDAKSFKGNA